MTILNDLLSPTVPDHKILYHYTTQDGLLGIIKSKTLWASSILHLNDSAEFNYTLDLARTDVGLKYLGAESGPKRMFFAFALDFLEILKTTPLFVGSFSLNGDLLSQWRAYTQNGIGFSLGFEYDYLRGLAEAQGFKLLRCNYNRAEHEQAITELIDASCLKINPQHDVDVQAIRLFTSQLVNIASVLKHPSFAEEKEWRLVSAEPEVDGPVLFRSGKSMVVPYKEFKLAEDGSPLQMRDLCIGPTPHVEMSKFSIEQLMSRAKTNANIVRSSTVPYRSW